MLFNIKHSKGFTLVEILVVIAIIIVVMAIAFPVLRTAKESSLKTVTISNLKQLWQATEIYRIDHDGTGFGRTADMGLPPDKYLITDPLKLSPPRMTQDIYHKEYVYYPVSPDADSNLQDLFAAWAKTCEGQTVIFADLNFNEYQLSNFNPYQSVFAIGVTLNGSIRKRTAIGDALRADFWKCKE